MNETKLSELLREIAVPGGEAAQARGLALVEAAFAERQGPGERRSISLPRLALALALVTLLAALLLSPAGAAVRDWVDDVFTSAPRSQSGLAEIPGGGRLLVQSPEGPWVVQPDGSRRLLGGFAEAGWSPHGLFVATVSGRDLSALEPDGTPRWTITAPRPVFGPRWSPSGYRIAYRSGAELRVTAADGTGDHRIAPRVAAISPAWSPFDSQQLAYVDDRGVLQVADSETGATLASAPALPAVQEIEWASSGALVEASTSVVRVRTASVDKLAGGIELGPAQRQPLPARASAVSDVAIAPSGKAIAAVVELRTKLGPRSVVLLFAAGGGGQRRLLTVPGRISQVLWGPNDGRLLLAWPDADQWLFLPTGRGEGRTIAGVAAAFSPGERHASFPRIEGWCCHVAAAD